MLKRFYSIIFVLVLSGVACSQTGTIRIQRPMTDTKDTVNQKPKQKPLALGFVAGTNYTFKNINEVGCEVTVIRPLVHRAYWGVKYSRQAEYFQLSFHTNAVGEAIPEFQRTVVRSDYVKLPVGYSYPMNFGANGNVYLSAGAEGEYLFNMKDQSGILKYRDFRKFNVSGFVGLGFRIGRYSITARYFADVLENLKNTAIYDQTGLIAGRQKSRTNLISLSVSYGLLR